MVNKILRPLYLAFILLITYVPIIILVIFSFTDAVIIGQWNGFSFELYRKLFADSMIMGIVKDTLLLAISSAAIATTFGTIGAIGIFYSSRRRQKIVGSISNIPLINADIVTAVSLALMFALIFGGKSLFSLLAGHVVICIPFVITSVTPKLKQMDNNLYEAALDLGATPSQALFTVIIPEILPGIISGFLLSITLSLDDYIITAFTKPATFHTISTYVYEAVKNQSKSSLPQLRALSAIIFVVMIAIVIYMNFKPNKKQGVTNK